MRRPPPWVLLVAAAAVCALGAGCDEVAYPQDPGHTYEDVVARGVVHAGIAEDPPWTRIEGGRAVGVEPALVEGLAADLGVRVEWQQMTQHELIEALDTGQIDIAAGGFVQTSPWRKHAGFTRPYVRWDRQKHVLAVPRGENRWLMQIERYLAPKGPTVRRALDDHETEEVIR